MYQKGAFYRFSIFAGHFTPPQAGSGLWAATLNAPPPFYTILVLVQFQIKFTSKHIGRPHWTQNYSLDSFCVPVAFLTVQVDCRLLHLGITGKSCSPPIRHVQASRLKQSDRSLTLLPSSMTALPQVPLDANCQRSEITMTWPDISYFHHENHVIINYILFFRKSSCTVPLQIILCYSDAQIIIISKIIMGSK